MTKATLKPTRICGFSVGGGVAAGGVLLEVSVPLGGGALGGWLAGGGWLPAVPALGGWLPEAVSFGDGPLGVVVLGGWVFAAGVLAG